MFGKWGYFVDERPTLSNAVVPYGSCGAFVIYFVIFFASEIVRVIAG